MKLLKNILFIGLFSLLFFSANAQDYRFHNIYFKLFINYIEWPQNDVQNQFVIGVLGDSQVIHPLERLSKKMKAKGKQIVIKRFATIQDLSYCHMLFLPKNESEWLEVIRKRFSDTSMLVITEKAGLAHQGSGINFIKVNGQWRFEVNTESIHNSSLRISDYLLKIASKV
ncbi:MAG: YfiR family protein [Cytophagales bacterium]|nr:YfiR family protein [Cytophagales bacterium]